MFFTRISKTLGAVIAVVLAAAIGPSAKAGTIDAAADWLLTQQTPSGGFPWTPGGAVTNNTQGATALGLIGAYEVTGNAAYLNAAKSNGDYILSPAYRHYSDGDPRFSTHDPMFLEILSAVTGDPSYADFTQTNFWDKLSAGTYGEANDLNATGFGNAVISARTGQGIVELSPWDLSKTAIAAHIAGETAIRDALMNRILAGLEATTASDNTYDLFGLSGAIWASAVTGVDLDPTAGRWASANSTADLAAELINYINADGGWIWGTAADINDPSNGDVQQSAFSILALAALDPTTYASQISGARAFVAGLQQPSGQILAYPGAAPGASGSVEVHGEALYALAVTVPEPATLALFAAGLVGLGFLRRR